MEELWDLLNTTLLGTQLLAALVGFVFFFKLKKSYWRWFSVYLIIICIWEHVLNYFLIVPVDVKYLLNLFFILPLEFIFFYWLYAIKSLHRKKLFLFCLILYVAISFLSAYFIDKSTAVSLSTNLGTLILIILVVFEYFKQIKNEKILKFRENKMFYINLGVVLFYVGSLPFQVFQKFLYDDYKTVVEYYFIYFLVSNCIMYLLFAASFIWGKEQL